MKVIDVQNIGFEHTDDNFFEIRPVGNSETIFRVPYLNQVQVLDGINKLRGSFSDESSQKIVERARQLELVVDELKIRKQELVDSVCFETGKPRALAESEFIAACEFLNSLAGAAKFRTGDVIPSANPKKVAIYERVPFGLAALIVSFNTPLPNYAWKIGPSFLAGNLSILKPSPHTPLSAYYFVDAFQKILGGKSNVFLLLGGSDQAKYLIETRPELISFTGSYEGGISVQKYASDYSPKIILELGGNNAFVVFGDANLEGCIEAAFQSAFSNSGQRCAAGSRILLEESLYDEFVQGFKLRIMSTKLGIGADAEVGPVINKESFNRLLNFSRNLQTAGLEIFQTQSPSESDLMFPPSFVEIPKNELHFMNGELFGPFARVIKFKSEDEAIELANMPSGSLTAAVWTNDINRALRLSKQIKAGIVNINGPTHGAEFQFPFGGTGFSGNGAKEVGVQSLNEYSFSKLTTILYS